MSEPEGDLAQITRDDEARGGARGRRGPRLSGCLPVLVVLAIIVGLGYVGVTKGQQALEDYFADPADYSGPGRGEVAFQVAEGDTVAEIGRKLKDQDVVASVEAFIETANGDDRATGIQVGYYELRRKMASTEALSVLVDPGNLVNTTVTVPEGLRVVDVVDILAEETEFPRQRFEAVLDEPGRIGLPDYAGGDPEGYLFPSTYAFSPEDTPLTMLTAMVDRWRQAADDADLEAAAEALGYTPHELMTVASLVEAEGRGDDMPKVARVIYNRLENPDTSGTNGLLQIDAAVNFALGREPIARLTTDQIESVSDSPYNTYTQPGLPPGPIEAPGDAAIAAAAAPADGPWYYYATVNLETGETKFTESYEEFLGFRAELDEYCATQSDRC
jgi:UPF0755 protein